MSSIRSAIENTIPISLFNRGLAGKIFDEVKRYGLNRLPISFFVSRLSL